MVAVAWVVGTFLTELPVTLVLVLEPPFTLPFTLALLEVECLGLGTAPGIGPLLGLEVTNGFLPSSRWFMATGWAWVAPGLVPAAPLGCLFVMAPEHLLHN